MRLTGAQILVSEMKRQGVTTVFGYPGGSILSVYDALADDSAITQVTTVDERGAVFAADGYSRSGAGIGVCLATSGPGATNLVTGVASAFMDSVPMVIITGNVASEVLGHDGFQEVDTAGITMPVTKYNFIVKDVDKLSEAVARAFFIASSGRKGPVLIDIPSNILDEATEYITGDECAVAAKSNLPDMNELDAAAEIINASVRPLIYAGGGVAASGTGELVIRLAEKINAPVALSLMGIGGIPSSHKNYIGVGTAVNKIAKEALKECDAFITLGARFSNKATEKALYKKSVKLIHLDIDNAEINKIITADAPVCGDLSDTLPLLLSRLTTKSDTSWIDSVLGLKTLQTVGSQSHIGYIKALNRHFGGDYIVTTDVGQHQLWVANYYDFETPKRFLSSCGLGAMGFGLGAAIGAHFATGLPVLTITGDGSFNMSFNELLTVAQYKIPVCVAIMNNGSLGMIRETQTRAYNGRHIGCDLEQTVNYGKLAAAYDINYARAENPQRLTQILASYDDKAPIIIDCIVGKNEKAL